ncbi:thiamine diphosphokinase [Flavicella sediminum]|uniref:thiamine diphosphokinase n=1 Tax=Flavicella sediminum TaxID=2585141 RepID=UPI00111DB16C|nr:thiamine diphosphokinase [Flavicella sediminum]
MKPTTAFLLLNGAAPKHLPNLKEYSLVCAIDGGYNHLRKMGIEPHLVTGDFDSIIDKPEHIEVIHTPDQNFTDFEKALQILQHKNITEVHVYGGSGKEHDHFLGNISTALQWKQKLNITFFDDYGRYYFIENNFEINNIKNSTVSLIPFPFATEIETTGLLYPLNKEKLVFGERIGTRNKAKDDTIKINFKEGSLLIYISHK